MTNHSNRHDDQVISGIRPIHPDAQLAADYLTGNATPEQRAEFERRFVEDDEFFEYVGPMMKAWHAPVSYRALANSEAIVVPQRVREVAAAEYGAGNEAANGPRMTIKSASYRRYRRWGALATKLVAAVAVIMFITVEFIRYRMLTPGRLKVLEEAQSLLPLAAPGSVKRGVANDAAAAGFPGTVTPAVKPHAPLKVGEGITLADTLVGVSTPKASNAPPPLPDSVRAVEELLKATAIGVGTAEQTGPGQTKVIELRNGVRVRLREKSAIRVLPALPLPGKAAKASASMVMLYLEGEAAFDAPPPDSGSMRVLAITTPAGHADVSLYGGRLGSERISTVFALRARKGTSLDVRVASGELSIGRAIIDSLKLVVKGGESGTVTPTSAARHATAAEATSYPVPDLKLFAVKP